MLTRRHGKFEVSVALIENNPEDVSKIFEGLVVTRAEHIFHSHIIEYLAWSPHFRELSENEATPEYMAMCSSQADGSITVKWVDLNVKAKEEINTLASSAVGAMKTIIVNGVEVKTDMFMASYADILQLTDLPFRADYTMTWSTKDVKGIMHYEGKLVQVTEGMIFNAIMTGDA